MSAKIKNIKPQLCLFDNNKCTQCDKKIKEGFVYCEDCSEDWAKKYLKEADK